ncbi:MAG: SpoVR family protein [Planctomycetota bacterium]|nr:SpoVR family protein [Planctomycetota bacterium]
MGQRRTSTDLPGELRAHMDRIRSKALEYGLTFPEVVFEVLDFQTMNQIAAYGGFAVRYPHWRWGMEYERLSKRDAYGLGRIYEMVINNDPCYAYLQESNALSDQKLVMAHVYGHADFFKNNYWFSKTDRKMMNTMANHATRVQRHINKHGQEPVERFIDCCLSIEHLIDPYSVFSPRGEAEAGPATGEFEYAKLPAKDYMDPFVNPREEMESQKRRHEQKRRAERGRVPARPTRDVLLFLMHHAPLEDWQQDVLSIVREESYYFAPQAMTKIMNEGWASYWHSKLMTEHFVEAAEIVDYAEQHSGVVHMPAGGFNPYKIGIELFKDIERRWNTGRHGALWERLDTLGARERFDDNSMKGREKIFEVRRIYNDVNFIDEFLSEEFVERHQMYRYKRDPQTGELRVVSRDWRQVKQTLLYQITNMGQPFVYVLDANYQNRGELFLAHQWNGLDLDLAKSGEVLKNLREIWGRPVHVHTRLEDEPFLLSAVDPESAVRKEKVTDRTPAPAQTLE